MNFFVVFHRFFLDYRTCNQYDRSRYVNYVVLVSVGMHCGYIGNVSQVCQSKTFFKYEKKVLLTLHMFYFACNG